MREPSLPAIEPTPRQDFTPLSLSQQRLWFLDQLEGSSATHNLWVVTRLSGTLHFPALEKSFTEIVQRHEILRTHFSIGDNLPVQTIGESFSPLQGVIDFQFFPTAEQTTELRRFTMTEASRPFDLAQSPLLRVFLLKLSQEEHVLQVVMHHMIADEWSVHILMRELSALYNAFVQNVPCPLLPLSIQYTDFVHWQQQCSQKNLLETQLHYWWQQLAGAPARLEFPTDYPRPAAQRYQGATQVFHLEGTLTDKLKVLSQRENATLFMTLLAAFATLLSRYSGQEDIVIGNPLATRTYPSIEHLIGLFANTLVLRINLSEQPNFITLLQRVRQTVLEAQEHQDVSFEQLIEEIKPTRSLSYTPLFQVAFRLENCPAATPNLIGITATPLIFEEFIAKFDLTLFLEETAQGLNGRIIYNIDLFEQTTIIRFITHFQTLLTGLITAPEQKIQLLPLLTPQEIKQFETWNATQITFPTTQCIHHLFESQVTRTPTAIATVFEQKVLTYTELNQRANQLAHYLQTLGVGVETIVGICIERSLEMIIALLGVLKAGGTYLPLDPSYPAARLTFMLKDAKISVLLTQKKIGKILSADPTQHICLDSEWAERIQGQGIENPTSAVRAENLAYIIYTSGSTGQPKGVMISHRALINHMYWMQNTFPLTAADKVLQKTPFSFDASVWEFYAPLIAGGQLIFAQPEGHKNSRYLITTIIQHQITILQLVPSLLHVLLLDNEVTMMQSLKRIFCGGEMLTPSLIGICKTKLEVEIINLYGLTEACIDNTFWICPQQTCPLIVPIGHPIANTEIYILDTDKKRVPIGVAGELYIGGVSLARGYLNHPELTREKFIDHPFISGAKLYKTGDRARYLSTGDIEYLGRLDNQVKLRGFRIELGEIETVISQYPSVRENAVVIHEEHANNEQLSAYIVYKQEHIIEKKELRTFLRQRLPDYMIPATFIELEKLPLTPNGKIDRRVLSKMTTTNAHIGFFEAPRTPEEELLAGLWKKLVKVEKISIHDNFFDLGGHSLLVAQLLSHIRETFGVTPPLRTLFESATLAEQSQTLLKTQAGEKYPPILAQPRDKILPLSFSQQKLWFLHYIEKTNIIYNIHRVIRLKGPLDREALIQSFQEIVSRHENLRTRFPFINGEPIQIIEPLLLCTINWLEVKDDQKIQHYIQQAITQPFDLKNDTLLKITLIRCSAQEHILIVVLHRIIADDRSLDILITELSNFYNVFSYGEPSTLSELTIQYADFAVWQRNWLKGDIWEKQLTYWKQKLTNIPPPLELPTDRPRLSDVNYRGATYPIVFNTTLSKQLRQLSQQANVTLFMTLLAAFATLLARYSGQNDIIIGSPVFNRTHSQLENLVGLLVNKLILRINLNKNPTFIELLQQTRQTTLEAYHHQDIPFEQLLDTINPEYSDHTALCQIMFFFQNTKKNTLEFAGLTVEPVTLDSPITKFDLTLALEENTDSLQGNILYRTDLFDENTIIRLSNHFQVLLKSSVANPQQNVFLLPLLTSEEEHQLAVWNQTVGNTALDFCIHQHFEEQVQKTPEATAMLFNREKLTYTQLNKKANQLAHYLINLGVKPNTLIGLYLDRSSELIVGILGVLKAGAAYLVLEPDSQTVNFPFVMEDAKITFLLTMEKYLSNLGSAKIICLDCYEFSKFTEENPNLEENSEQLACVIYTTDTAGQSQGVLMPHRALINHIQWMQITFPISNEDKMLQKAPLHSDTFAWEIFTPLLTGAQLVLSPLEIYKNFSYTIEIIDEYKITILQLAPSLLQSLLQAENFTKMTSLRRIYCGGEVLSSTLVEDCVKKLPNVEIIYFYGVTEVGINTTYWVCSLENLPANIPIGYPITNIQIYLFDNYLNQVPIGVNGEIYIGGAGLSHGYLNRPDLMAKRFIFHPIDKDKKLYKTGDFARWSIDGTLNFLVKKVF